MADIGEPIKRRKVVPLDEPLPPGTEEPTRAPERAPEKAPEKVPG